MKGEIKRLEDEMSGFYRLESQRREGCWMIEVEREIDELCCSCMCCYICMYGPT